MLIKQIEVKNFKSFKHAKIDLQNLNILIGANASGKSNFVRIFEFLSNIVHYSLSDAISIEGGIHYLWNTSPDNSSNLYIRVVYDPQLVPVPRSGAFEATIQKVSYEFEIKFIDKKKDFTILQDKLCLTYELTNLMTIDKYPQTSTAEVLYSLADGQLKADVHLPDGLPINPDSLNLLLNFVNRKFDEKTLFIQSPLFVLIHENLKHFVDQIGVYEIEPKLTQMAIPIGGKQEMEKNASNLAIVLNNILADSEKKRTFVNLASYLLPFVEDVQVEKLANRLLISLQETHQPDFYFPAFLLSDGTLMGMALIALLYFEEKSLLILEEPEKHIHPSLIARLMELLQEVSANKQLIVTTHDPEVIKFARLEDLILLSRDKQGFSTVHRPVESENVKIFLRNEVGVQDLFVKDLLGV